MTQRALGEAADVHPVTIALLESGGRQAADQETVAKLAAALGVRPGDLLEEQHGWAPVEDAISSWLASGLAAIACPEPADLASELDWLRSIPGLFWVGAPPSDESLTLLVQAHRKSRK